MWKTSPGSPLHPAAVSLTRCKPRTVDISRFLGPAAIRIHKECKLPRRPRYPFPLAAITVTLGIQNFHAYDIKYKRRLHHPPFHAPRRFFVSFVSFSLLPLVVSLAGTSAEGRRNVRDYFDFSVVSGCYETQIPLWFVPFEYAAARKYATKEMERIRTPRRGKCRRKPYVQPVIFMFPRCRADQPPPQRNIHVGIDSLIPPSRGHTALAKIANRAFEPLLFLRILRNRGFLFCILKNFTSEVVSFWQEPCLLTAEKLTVRKLRSFGSRIKEASRNSGNATFLGPKPKFPKLEISSAARNVLDRPRLHADSCIIKGRSLTKFNACTARIPGDRFHRFPGPLGATNNPALR